MLSAYVYASSQGVELDYANADIDHSTDIVQRTVNFVLFAAVLYYLLAEPVKNFFSGRSQGIADELDKVQEKLRESKREKEQAESKIVEAEKFAKDLLATSKKENELINDKMMKNCESELEVLQKQNRALMELEKRQMVREVVSEIMNEVLTEGDTSLSKEDMAQIIMKKVA
jgi:F-type H+-transporting ATPase subunit b